MAKSTTRSEKRRSSAGRARPRTGKTGRPRALESRKSKRTKSAAPKQKPPLPLDFAQLKSELKAARFQAKEALDRQAATADVLKVISRSSVELGTVLHTLVETVARLCRADQVYMFHLNRDLWHLVADHGLSTEARDYFRNNPFVPGRGATSGRAALEGRAVHIPDVLQDPEYTLSRGQEIASYRTTLAIPLLREETLVGVYSLARTRVKPFTDKEIELATTFADQAVIAIENARLFNEVYARTRDLKESLQQQTATADVLKVISRSAFDLKTVLDTLVESACRLCQADMGNIARPIEGDRYRVEASYGQSLALNEELVRRPLKGKGSVIGRTALTRATVHILDAQTDPDYELQTARRIDDYHTMLGVPLMREDKVIGVFGMARRRVLPFTDRQIELVTTFADQAVIAIENARLFNETKEALERQRASSEVLAAISGSMADARPVFEVIVQSCERLFGSSAVGLITMREDGQLDIGAYGGQRSEVFRSMYPTPLTRDSASGIAILDRRTFVCEDIDAPGVPPLARDGCRALGIGSAIFAPLLAEGQSIGSLWIGHEGKGTFAPERISLVEAFASQAVIAIQNAKLFAEVQARTRDLEESLQQQTATADVLKSISRSAFDLDSVLSTLVGSAAKLCEAERGLIFLREGDLYHTSANFGFSPELEAFAKANPLPADGKSTTARAGVSGAPVQAVDILADETQGFLAREYQRLGGHRTTLGVPLRRDGETIGVFTLTRQTVQAFTPRQIELVQTFADQAVIAIENSRLLEQVQAKTRDLEESLQQQTATADVLKAISRSAFDLEAVLNALIEAAARLCEADQGAIARQQGQVFVRVATWGFSDDFARMVAAIPVEPERGSAIGRALLERATVHIPNVDRDPEYNFTDAKRLGRFKTIIAVPMLREGAPIGVLSLTRIEERPFTAKQLELVSTFTDQAAIAIENDRLFEQVQAKTQELSQSLEDLRAAQDRLVQTEKLASLGQLTAGIAHEIKNPLNFINNFSALSVELVDEMNEVLADTEVKGKKREELDEIRELLKSNLEKVVQHGKRADSIVKNMLLHSRQGAGERRPVEINALVDESLNLAYHGARAEKSDFNIALQRDFDPGAGIADVYPQEITRVLLNLLSNGFYAATKRASETDSGFEPKLWVATKDLADRVEIRVRDNGTGIPGEVRNEIFNPFFTTKPAGEGTGLGLSMSHDIVVKQHGGAIEVETEVGTFTEFRIVLPRAAISLTRSGEQV